MARRQKMTFFDSYYEVASNIDDDKLRLQFYDAVMAYYFDDIEPELSGIALALFAAVRPNIDSSKKRAEAGEKGGSASKTEADNKPEETEKEAPAKQTASKAEANCKQTASKSKANAKQTRALPLLEEVEEEVEVEKEVEKNNNTLDYQEIVSLYNETCVSLPRVRQLTDSRKRAIRGLRESHAIS